MSTKKVSSSKSKSTVDATTKNTALPSIPPSPSLLTDYDVHLFREGKHFKLYEKLGAHLYEHEGVKGTLFAVWAPNASYVSVVGDFNQWHAESNPLNPRWDGCGVWEIFVPAVGHGDLYKYIIKNRDTGEILEKFDPFAFFNEVPPKRASIVWDFQYQYKSKPINKETGYDALRKPYSIYEMHYASWKWNTIENRPLSYREMATELVPYLLEMGYTHVEFLPLTEHPYSGSWGYQTTGFFAPTSRFGTPEDFAFLVDELHTAGIGIIMDWVPSHFPEDSFALARFDGTNLYEHADPRKGFHPDWKSLIFNYGRFEVRSFLISSAFFWLERYQMDALRVDAVASMLYLDYSRKHGEWEPNIYGGNENLEAISFLKDLNQAVYENFPHIQMIAEESTSWPMVSRPVSIGGLGFGMKWMMGWMHDTLSYFKTDPVYREYHQHDITFSIYYGFTENFMLPLSHDEVVHGKGSLIQRMPGDDWQKFANLRALYGYMFTHPGTKLLFMGAEFGQYGEWNYQQSLDWHLLQHEPHVGIQKLIKNLNKLYKSEKALYERSFETEGFEWIDLNDNQNSVLSYVRKGLNEKDQLIVICNLTPVPRENYRIGSPLAGEFELILNSDEKQYWGSGFAVHSKVKTEKAEKHGRANSLSLNLPPLSVLVYKPKASASKTISDKKTEKSSLKKPAESKANQKESAPKKLETKAAVKPKSSSAEKVVKTVSAKASKKTETNKK